MSFSNNNNNSNNNDDDDNNNDNNNNNNNNNDNNNNKSIISYNTGEVTLMDLIFCCWNEKFVLQILMSKKEMPILKNLSVEKEI